MLVWSLVWTDCIKLAEPSGEPDHHPVRGSRRRLAPGGASGGGSSRCSGWRYAEKKLRRWIRARWLDVARHPR